MNNSIFFSEIFENDFSSEHSLAADYAKDIKVHGFLKQSPELF